VIAARVVVAATGWSGESEAELRAIVECAVGHGWTWNRAACILTCPALLRPIYAAAVGASPDDWRHLDESMAAERHTGVLIRPARVYSSPA